MHRGRKFQYRRENCPQSLETKSTDVNFESEIVKELRSCAKELEEKQDRHERILKIGRDITIDSKRLIFYLHTFQKGVPDADEILVEAETRLIKIATSHFYKIAKELIALDMFQFTRAFTYGVQEFIEAFSFYHYLAHNNLLTYDNVKEFLAEYVRPDVEAENGDTCGIETQRETFDPLYFVSNFVTMVDYVLGLSDLTGELMRYCINQVAAGRNEIAFDTCRFLTHLYTGMLSVSCHTREFNRKMYTFMQNVRKVEMACYTIRVRGSEMPKHAILDVLNQEDEPDVDLLF